MNYKLAKPLEVRYDVNYTTEVNLRDTMVTFLNELMKRVQKTLIYITINSIGH